MLHIDGLLKPEELTLVDDEGKNRTYYISNFDAVTGRKIISQYPLTGAPKIGDYEKNEALMFEIMSYVAVPVNGTFVRLTTRDMVNNHIPDWEVLAKIEWAMLQKNCSFFKDGRSWDFLENLTQLFLSKLSEMLTPSSAQSLPQEKQPSTN